MHIEQFGGILGKTSNLIHERGVYMFLYPTKTGNQVYYIGKTENYYSRMKDHYRYYSSGCIWLPVDIKLFQDDIYALYRIEDPSHYQKYFQKPDGTKKMQEIGQHLLRDTKVALSSVQNMNGLHMAHIESLLIHGFLRKWKLPKMGWIGDSQTDFPSEDYTIINCYKDDMIRNELSDSIPEKVTFEISIE